jgi:hypothetical protein
MPSRPLPLLHGPGVAVGVVEEHERAELTALRVGARLHGAVLDMHHAAVLDTDPLQVGGCLTDIGDDELVSLRARPRSKAVSEALEQSTTLALGLASRAPWQLSAALQARDGPHGAFQLVRPTPRTP